MLSQADGSPKIHKEGQDTGSDVYHPRSNVSHYVNPRGVGNTNTISRAELAAIAAAIIHGYLHIATGTKPQCTKLENSSRTQISTATTSREVSSNPLQKKSTSHHLTKHGSVLSHFYFILITAKHLRWWCCKNWTCPFDSSHCYQYSVVWHHISVLSVPL